MIWIGHMFTFISASWFINIKVGMQNTLHCIKEIWYVNIESSSCIKLIYDIYIFQRKIRQKYKYKDNVCK